jgi:AraC family transcriptional regulator
MNGLGEVSIQEIAEKKLVGKRLSMTFAENKTAELWRGFMPRRSEIQNAVGSTLFSLQVYENVRFFADFALNAPFEKWALMEVTDFEQIPVGMKSFVLANGLYAVFPYKGNPNNPQVFYDIFEKWLPNSRYELDNRPHFEVLGEKYKHNDDDSEEEIWIPIRAK